MNRALGWWMSAMFLVVFPVEPRASVSSDDPRGGFGGSEPCLLEQGVDRMETSSTACLRCHDGSRGAFFGRRGAHPVEVAYRPGGVGERRLRSSPERRAVNLALPDGRITCLTCHDSRSRLPFRLAASMTGPREERLCEACHTVGE